MYKFSKVWCLLWLAILLSACATKKKRSETGWVGKMYHNMTAKFNGYYNATVLLDESKLTLEDQYNDNYNQLLVIDPLIATDNPQAVAADLDKAIEKVITVAYLHPQSHWVDDCYLLMGAAQYLKQDFETTEETLEYFREQFDPGIPESRRRQPRNEERSNADKRREELQKARELRAEDKAREEEYHVKGEEIDRSRRELRQDRKDIESEYRSKKRDLEQDHRKEEQDFKQETRELEREHKEELDKLKEKHRENAKERRKQELEAERKAREELIKQREEAARENTRSERRKKTNEEEEEDTKTQAQVPQIDPEEVIRRQEEMQIQALEQEHKMEMDAQMAKQAQLEQEWASELTNLENEYQNKSNIINQEEKELDQQEVNLTKVQEREEEQIQEQREAELLTEEEKDPKIDSKKDSEEINKGQGGGLFKHKPVYYEGLLLLAKTYVQRHNWSSAEYILRKLRDTPEISKEVARELPVVHANLYIKREKYEEAIPQLQQAIELADKREKKARYAYIMAQLYQILESSENAYRAFGLAADESTDYEMEFNAKLSMARNAWATNAESMESSMNSLDKMMKDGKNKEYLDQIYFTKAEIKLASGDESGAFEDFKKALAASQGNTSQQTETYYRLANIYYDLEDYQLAKAYFDSTITVMPQRDPRFDEVKRLANNLQEIARNLQILELQDSLLRLSALSDEELDNWAKEQFERKKELEEELADEIANEDTQISTPLQGSLLNRGSNQSTFFAYNPLALQKGKLDFARKWGNRSLEDDWRRTNKQSSIIVDRGNTSEQEELSGEQEMDAEIKALLQDVPRSEQQIITVKQKKETALYQLGTLYRSNIQKFEASISSLNELLADFPDTKYKLDAYYNLYLDYYELNDPAKIEQYAHRIVSEFPESEYAKIISDPDYLAKLEAEKNRLDHYYNETYDIFLAGNYVEAELRIEGAGEMFDENKYAAKFDLLDVMIEGSKAGKDAYIKELNDFIVKYPNTPEQTRAKEILRFLQGDEEAFDSRIYEEALEEFTTEDDKLHYIIIVVYNADESAVNDAKIKLAKYHNTYHKLDKLRLSNIYLNPEINSQIILIRRFENKDNALAYIEGTHKNYSDFLSPSDMSFEIFAVTQRNYREIMKQRTVKNYRFFFDNNYTQ